MTHPNTVHTILKRADAGVSVDDIAYEFGMANPEVLAILASDEAQTREMLAGARLRLANLQAPEMWAERASMEHHIQDLENQQGDKMLNEFDAIPKIKAMVTSYAILPLWMKPQDNGPNPFYGQTFSGLFLLHGTCAPSTLWTPWGQLELGGSSSGDWNAATREILVRLGATMYRAGGDTERDVYSLTKVDDQITLTAVERPLSDHVDHKTAKACWARGVMPGDHSGMRGTPGMRKA